MHMLFGAVLGWGVLSPLAKYKRWAPGDTASWDDGSKGWIVWVSLSIMLADSVINLAWLIAKPIITSTKLREIIRGRIGFKEAVQSAQHHGLDDDEDDVPSQHLISTRTVLILLPATLVLNVVCIHLAFPGTITLPLTLLATLLALILSVMGVRALGETDLNPVSGISKLTQLVFALVTPKSNPNAIIINLIAGAVSESGALQAGDMLQDIKTGHLLGASPKAQFWGQSIGSVFGAVISAAIYKLYVSVYDVPGDEFQTPTAYVWIFTARLVTGKGLPEMVWPFAVGFAILWAIFTAIRINGSSYNKFIPGGIAVAVGMYNVPSFTLARAIGGVISWAWGRYWWLGGGGQGVPDETRLVVLASGLIIGEGLISIVNLALASAGVVHI